MTITEIAEAMAPFKGASLTIAQHAGELADALRKICDDADAHIHIKDGGDPADLLDTEALGSPIAHLDALAAATFLFADRCDDLIDDLHALAEFDQ
jgi:hypothetical protein